jgi:hypothetical protein
VKKILLPDPLDDYTFLKVWEQVVFPQPAWRTSLVNSRAALAIDEKFQCANGEAVITDSEHELLLSIMQLQPTPIQGPTMQVRYYMRCLIAVQDAATVHEAV